MITLAQRLAIKAASVALRRVGIDVWFDLRLIKDSSKDLFGSRLGERGQIDELLKLADAKRVALRPEFRIELRMYATVTKCRGVSMGVELDEASDAGGVVLATAHGATLSHYGRTLLPKVTARASGTVLTTSPEIPNERDDA